MHLVYHGGVQFGTPLPLTTQHLLDMTYYVFGL